ncbi:hypothetical protein C2U69_33860 [Cupriavidus pinatubonensis]|nr:hypothetical protein [Cupriavidus pinatubonensis]TPQ27736.1 hypothetical protein C2U69_33860 [Cupriavidus pinatubonensis]
MRNAMLVAGLFLLALQGCATKNYGRQGNLTDFEKQTMSCREIELEQAKVQGFIQHVNKESEFDGRSVLSFLGDFGIGNIMEKDSAMKSGNDRAYQLEVASYQRGCSTAKPQPTAQIQPTAR